MTRLYRLEVALAGNPNAVFSATFDFVAEDDREAQELVTAFARVTQPVGVGPLNCVGESEMMDGLEVQKPFDDEKDYRFVPLEVVRLG